MFRLSMSIAGLSVLASLAALGDGGRTEPPSPASRASASSANTAPLVIHANKDLLVAVGASFSYDATQNGSTMSDADGDPLRYRLSFEPGQRGFTVDGARISGTFHSIGLVRIKLTATDGRGGVAEDTFTIAAPAPEPGKPTLPLQSYVYDDAELSLPYAAKLSRNHFSPLWDTTPADNVTTNAGATLGRVLFYDKRLSILNTGSCASCHKQEHAFATNQRFTAGPHGDMGKRNVPGLTGVRYNLNNFYFADSRVKTLEKLVPMPIEDPTELANSMELLVQRLAATDFYPPLFQAAFGSRTIDADRIAKALAQFLRSMISFESKFDRAFHPLQEGEEPRPDTVLTAQELRGAEVFNGAGRCFFCHAQGMQTMDIPANTGLDAVPADTGSGKGEFRIASLRNVAVTAPYMHDGRFATLKEVIEHYSSKVIDSPQTDFRMRGMSAKNSLNLNLSAADKEALEAFLHTLTDSTFLSDPRFSDPFQ